MHIVLLCGGAGKRLWPLSTDERSKPFLPLLPDGCGGRCSMIQRIWGQMERAGLAGRAYAAIVRQQRALLDSQLEGALPAIVEPERRDTFPSIALSAVWLHSVREAGREEVACVLPADTYADDAYFQRIQQLESALDESGAALALIGVKPAYPSEEHGYLITGKSGEDGKIVTVERFVEKPDKRLAEQLIERHALWNSGVFAFRLGMMLDWLEERGFPLDYEALVQRFAELPKTSFDYEVAEKTASRIALIHEGQWKDLGTWPSLAEELGCAVIGQGSISEEAKNSHVINEGNIPAVVLGLSNVIVVIGKNGILVADKEASRKIKGQFAENERERTP